MFSVCVDLRKKRYIFGCGNATNFDSGWYFGF